MSYQFDASRPIYLQLLDDFRTKIAGGEWPAGGRIDSVRDLALRYNVNPNTVQRSLSELERQGLCRVDRSSGRSVTQDEERIIALKDEMAMEKLGPLIEQMKALGLSKEEAAATLIRFWEKQETSPQGRKGESQ